MSSTSTRTPQSASLSPCFTTCTRPSSPRASEKLAHVRITAPSLRVHDAASSHTQGIVDRPTETRHAGLPVLQMRPCRGPAHVLGAAPLPPRRGLRHRGRGAQARIGAHRDRGEGFGETKVQLPQGDRPRRHHVPEVVGFNAVALLELPEPQAVAHGRQVSEVERATEKAGCGRKEPEEGRRPYQGASGSGRAQQEGQVDFVLRC